MPGNPLIMNGAYTALRIRAALNKLRSFSVKYQEDEGLIDDIEKLVDPSTVVSTIQDDGLKSEIKQLVSLASDIITSIICTDGCSEIKNRARALAKNIGAQKQYPKMDPEETDVSSTEMTNKYELFMLLMLIREMNDHEKAQFIVQKSDDVARVACMLRSLRLRVFEYNFKSSDNFTRLSLYEYELREIRELALDIEIELDMFGTAYRSGLDLKHCLEAIMTTNRNIDILKVAIMSWSYPEIEMLGHRTDHKSIGNLDIQIQPKTFASEDQKPTNNEINLNEIMSSLIHYPPVMKMIKEVLEVNCDEIYWKQISKIISQSIKYGNNVKQDIMFKLLLLCYSQMPAPLCCCFIYCSMFPKHWIFEPENMLQLWTSQGFILTNNGKEKIEDVGRRYFHELVSRSFFEPLQVNGNTSYYTMHPTVHRFAEDSCGEQFLRIDSNNFDTPNEFEYLWGTRHLSITTDQLHILREESLRLNNLTTLIILGSLKTGDGIILDDSISKLKIIRTLYLEGYVMSKVSETDTSLLHLRYLNLLSIKNLSKNFNILDLLEVLKLEEFRVGNEKEHDISQLGDLSMLRGSLSITNLENVLNDKEAAKARLSEKSGLTSLKLEWSSETETNCNTVNQLKPPIAIKVIELKGYPCPHSPDWLENNWLENVVEVSLTDCMNLVSLPPLGSLAYLRILKLYNLPSVKPNVPSIKRNSDDRHSTDDTIGFKSLEELFVEHMPKANKIVTNNYKECFPRLRRFLVRDCSMLEFIPQICSPMLTEVVMERVGLTSFPLKISGPLEESTDSTFSIEVIECPDICSINGDLNIKSVTKLVLQKCPELMTIAPAVFSGLVFLELIGCHKLEVALHIKSMGHLEGLRIQGCPKITIQHCKEEENGKQSTSSLRILHTDNISIISELLLKTVPLQVLTIEECSQLGSLSILMIKGSSVLEKLQQLCLTSCENLKALPRNMKAFSSLERLFLKDCAKIGSLPVLPTSLEQLQIIDCPILEERCQEDGPDWTKISHIPYKLIE